VLTLKVAPVFMVLAVASPTVLPGFARRDATPPAPAIAPDFEIVGSQSLPRRCDPEVVAPEFASVLGAFNAGRTTAFTRRFAASARFEAYSGRPAGRYIATGHAAIASVVRRRHSAGDGWTAFKLVLPAEARGEAIFGLFLRVRADSVSYEQGVKVIVSCSTGLIRTWRGPAWSLG
jgi:hypothetical protein